MKLKFSADLGLVALTTVPSLTLRESLKRELLGCLLEHMWALELKKQRKMSKDVPSRL